MKKIDENLLERLQTLSMISIAQEKKGEVLEDLNRFLEFVENLNSLDLEGLDATFNPLEAAAPLRKDEPHLDTSIGEKILQRAPKSADNFFIVPKIIE